MATVTSDTSPAALLSRFRGPVANARLTYPERAAFDVTDADGGQWHLSTWYAYYSPANPEDLNGKTIVSADLDDQSETLTVGFSDGTCLTVIPIPDQEDDAIENWDLFTPEGMVLLYGPSGRWKMADASESN